MYDGRLNLTLQVVREVKKYFGAKDDTKPIRRNVRLSEAPQLRHTPVNCYDPGSEGTEAYAFPCGRTYQKTRRGGNMSPKRGGLGQGGQRAVSASELLSGARAKG